MITEDELSQLRDDYDRLYKLAREIWTLETESITCTLTLALLLMIDRKRREGNL